MAHRLDRVTPRAILAAGWLLFLVYAWPGYLSTDSVAQLAEVREGWRTDLASPVMTTLWSAIEVVVAGPAGMLLVQSGLLLFGAYALFRRAMSPRAAATAAGAVLVFPPVATTMAVIWPDSLMAGALVAGAAAVTCERRGVKLAGLVLLGLAAATRDAALIAIAPIVIGGFRWRPGARRWLLIATAAAAWIAITLGAWTANRALTNEHVAPYAGTLAPLDVVGILHFAQVPAAELDDALADTPRVADHDLAKLARDGYGGPVFWLTHGDERVFDPPRTADERDAMMSAWRRLAAAHPVAYLRHRWHVFRGVLGISRKPVWSPVYASATGDATQVYVVSHDAAQSPVQGALVAAAQWLARTFLFHAYLYLALALVLLPLAIARGHADAACLLGAGLAHAAATFVLATSPEYRFAHALVTMTTIATILLIAARARREPAAAARS